MRVVAFKKDVRDGCRSLSGYIEKAIAVFAVFLPHPPC